MSFLISLVGLLVFLLFLFTIVRWLAGVRGGAPFVPSRLEDIRWAFDSIRLSSNDVVLDLGCGSGTILCEAARRGARVVGYEYHPFLVWIARWRLARLSARATIHRGDLFLADVSLASVVTIFGLKAMKERIETLVAQTSPGTTIVVVSEPRLDWPCIAERGLVRMYRRPLLSSSSQ